MNKLNIKNMFKVTQAFKETPVYGTLILFLTDIEIAFEVRGPLYLIDCLVNSMQEMAWDAKRPADEPLTGLFTGLLTAQFHLCFSLGRLRAANNF